MSVLLRISLIYYFLFNVFPVAFFVETAKVCGIFLYDKENHESSPSENSFTMKHCTSGVRCD